MKSRVIYDLAMRVPLAALMFYSAAGIAQSIRAHFFFHRGPANLAFVTGAASLFATEAFIILVAIMTLARMRPVRKLGGVLPRITALAAGILPGALAWLPKSPPSPARQIAGASLIMAGMIIAVASLARLGTSFSVMPEARRLITGGPYRFVRHPVYLGEAIQSCGILVLFPSVIAMSLIAVQLFLQVLRMGYEEQVLRETFPEYEAYARRTSSRIVPRFY